MCTTFSDRQHDIDVAICYYGSFTRRGEDCSLGVMSCFVSRGGFKPEWGYARGFGATSFTDQSVGMHGIGI